MAHELTNLIPSDRLRAWKQEYFVHLATVGVFLIATLLVIHGVLLIPSYVFLAEQVSEQQRELDGITSRLDTSEGQQTSARLAALAADTKYLARLKDVPSASAALRAVLAQPHAGISLVGITFTPPKAGTPGRMLLTGTASTRDALQNYQSVLAALPFVSKADLPIGVFAKDTDIPFAITLTGTLTP